MQVLDCVFCKIVAGEMDAKRVYEDDGYLAFDDIRPKAPVHVLVVPKQHTARLDELAGAEGAAGLGALFEAAVKVAGQRGLTDYRLIVNVGKEAGQEVFHTHVHVMGG